MTTAEIQRQYDEVIAPHYDRDPLSVTTGSLARAVAQLKEAGCLDGILPAANVLDLGIGTGLFLEQLRQAAAREIRPYGLDISKQMIDVAASRIPDLIAEVDDAAHIGRHFHDTPFDLVCTHFVTGFVPLSHLAPEIFRKLQPGGHWSFVGGTSRGFPELQRTADSGLVKLLFGGQELNLRDLKTPEDQGEVVELLEAAGFEVSAVETFEPPLFFANFDEFMDFAWRGGWLTPFIEELGLHNAGRFLKTLLNTFIFPVSDVHRVAIATARKPADA
ncbi:MAG: class I SAM-dependent methyltransferase [Planctomycetota bacterium]|jgi:ubiquinone/menaquinone biosynthesis C-methylase UbiE